MNHTLSFQILLLLSTATQVFGYSVQVQAQAQSKSYRTVEGDIIVRSPKGLSNGAQNAAIKGEEHRWTNGIILYRISSEFGSGQKRWILKAMDALMEKTCIKFKLQSSEASYPYVDIVPGEACSSDVGMKSIEYQPQRLILASGCFNSGIVIHELMHAIGFFHEQSRPDRDKFVEILWQNIQRGKEDNFKPEKDNEADTFGLPYDFDSVMHYGNREFGQDNAITIQPKVEGEEIHGEESLSNLDIKKINMHYKCTPNSPPTQPAKIITAATKPIQKPLTTPSPVIFLPLPTAPPQNQPIPPPSFCNQGITSNPTITVTHPTPFRTNTRYFYTCSDGGYWYRDQWVENFPGKK